MLVIELVLLAIAVILLSVGYRKTDRKLMLAGAVVLWLSAVVEQGATDFMRGFDEGMKENSASLTDD